MNAERRSMRRKGGKGQPTEGLEGPGKMLGVSSKDTGRL